VNETDINAFLVALTAEAKSHRAVNHRYLRALGAGSLPNARWALADFGRQYFGYSVHFPRYLATVIGRLERPDHRRALLENMTEESGSYGEDELVALEAVGVDREWIVGVAHPILFQRFRTAMGVVDRIGDEESIEVVCWREMFLGVLSGGSPAEAVGALGLGTEGIVSTMYLSFVDALRRLPDLSARDTVFFPLHTAVDDHHQETLLDIARHYAQNESGRRDLAKGMRKALALRSSFWDWMYERAVGVTDVRVVESSMSISA
jgi:pyrroloquinoline quinone (PQQ) biosynthesis protein C